MKVLETLKYTDVNDSLVEIIVKRLEYYKKYSNKIINFKVKNKEVIIFEREMNKKELLKQEKTLEKQALNVLLNMAGRRLV